MPKTCFCCLRREMALCLCRDGTCRRCLKCEQHCSCSLKPLVPTGTPMIRLCTGGVIPAHSLPVDVPESRPRRKAA
jgi:hypothetical protein